MAAKNTVDACEEIKIELSVKDLQQLKKKALQTGISYQNLISFLIHKYIDKINVQIAVD
jgi:predicted DNA binding CopG/RHH family protein